MKQLTRKAKKGQSTPLLVVDTHKALLKELAPHERTWLEGLRLLDEGDFVQMVPAKGGGLGRAVAVVTPDGDSPWPYAALSASLPRRDYVLEGNAKPDTVALAWALAGYAFADFKTADDPARLVWPSGTDTKEVTRLARATFLARDLITRPPSHLGPAELADATEKLGTEYGAEVKLIKGDALRRQGYLGIHTVGRASSRPPCLIDLRWGKKNAPRVTLVGKGVVFDSGGLDLKTAAGMLLMKKDMGGAAQALAVAQMVMDAELPVRLRVLIPAVENSVSANAYRPSDVITMKSGKTVEVGNTDAEGRLVLADALHEAQLEKPEFLLDFATLTGAARVALGTELPALFSTDDSVADGILAEGRRLGDPLWRMPLHKPYRSQLESDVADLSSTGSGGGYGGAITAALFLKEFAGSCTWSHIDVMAYNTASKPGRPKGGEAMGARAVYAYLKKRYAGAGAKPKGKKK